jgi:hypothetical protein
MITNSGLEWSGFLRNFGRCREKNTTKFCPGSMNFSIPESVFPTQGFEVVEQPDVVGHTLAQG